MRWFAKILLFLSFALVPTAVIAQTATTTLTVTVPERPLQAGVLSSCDGFVVTSASHSATCSVTVEVVDPTLHNTGWRLSLSASRIACDCGGTLPPDALTVALTTGPVFIDGQPVDPQGGPRLEANAVGRGPSSKTPLLVAKPGFGNGAYSVTVELRLMYPAHTTPGVYVPTWVVTVNPR